MNDEALRQALPVANKAIVVADALARVSTQIADEQRRDADDVLIKSYDKEQRRQDRQLKARESLQRANAVVAEVDALLTKIAPAPPEPKRPDHYNVNAAAAELRRLQPVAIPEQLFAAIERNDAATYYAVLDGNLHTGTG